MKVSPIKKKSEGSLKKNLGLILLLVFLILIIPACSPRIIRTKNVIPNCPPPPKPVRVLNNSIAGDDLKNAHDNRVNDHICLCRLKKLLGGTGKCSDMHSQ